MKCPILTISPTQITNDCMTEKCAFWDSREGYCYIVIITYKLDKIGRELEEIRARREAQ